MFRFKQSDLFGDECKAVVIREYERETLLLKKMIDLAAEAVSVMETPEQWTYEGICYLYAESIIAYAKAAYDNMMIGHHDVVRMIGRTMNENNVCLEVIQKYQKEELWKYYIVYSLKHTLTCYGKTLENDEAAYLDKICAEYGIEEEYTKVSKKEHSKKPYAYIDRNYGWTYKVNTKFSYAGLCDLVDKREYDDFKVMSMYSHGTDIHLKMNKSVFEGTVIDMISIIYTSVERLVRKYCWDCVDEEYDAVTEELFESIMEFLNS